MKNEMTGSTPTLVINALSDILLTSIAPTSSADTCEENSDNTGNARGRVDTEGKLHSGNSQRYGTDANRTE